MQSESQPIQEQQPRESLDPVVLTEAIALLKRLASLNGEFGNLAEAPLDAMLTAKQAGKWLQCNPGGLNKDAKAGLIPAVPRGNEWRFHPRTILEEGHRRFRKNR